MCWRAEQGDQDIWKLEMKKRLTKITCVYLIFSYSLWAYFIAVGKSWPNDRRGGYVGGFKGRRT